MNHSKNPESRADRRRDKENRLLNILIAAVVIAIVIVSFIVIPNGKDAPEEKAERAEKEEIVQPKKDDPEEIPDDIADVPEQDADELDEEVDLIVTEVDGDELIEKTIIDPAWEPIPTGQEGEHFSAYDGVSVDWQEKVLALSYATGLTVDEMTIWKLKNGGSQDKSIGIVSSKDTTEKYRVYLEWVDGKGWKPVEMDLLKTLDFKY